MAKEKEMEFTEVKAGEFMKFEKIGQEYMGILTDVEERENTLKPGEMQKIYTFEAEDGTEFRIGSRGSAFDSAMKKIVKGQWCKVIYNSDIPSKKKGNHPFKLIKVYEGQIDEEWSAKNVPVVNDITDDIESAL